MEKNTKTTIKRNPVLTDHKKVGKRFVPPFLQLGDFQEIEWSRNTLPEILWLGLLNRSFGLKKGADLGVSLAKAAVKSSPSIPKRWYGPMSSYSLLSEVEKVEVVRILGETEDLNSLRESLAPLVFFYPKCPIDFLYRDNPPVVEDSQMLLQDFKNFLIELYNKYEQAATLTQANAIYIAFATDMLKVASHISLADFPAIAEFPHTERSKKVAAGIYSGISGFMGMFLNQNFDSKYSEWLTYFWNRGLELEPCTFPTTEDIHD
ncbi:MAG: hypothetical protein GY845_02190 [Planctomycetes bacterium]|nr:hypothetical protein [Planctomycetota bacterium]